MDQLLKNSNTIDEINNKSILENEIESRIPMHVIQSPISVIQAPQSTSTLIQDSQLINIDNAKDILPPQTFRKILYSLDELNKATSDSDNSESGMSDSNNFSSNPLLHLGNNIPTIPYANSASPGGSLMNYTPNDNQYYIPEFVMSESSSNKNSSNKRELRLLKNREAAKECRRKKKEYVKCVENRVRVLEAQNKKLIEELKSLKQLYQAKELFIQQQQQHHQQHHQ